MIPNQQQTELTPENINRALNGMRKQLSGIEGEITTQRTDAQSSLFHEFASILDGFMRAKIDTEHKLKEHEATLEMIYQGHPDIQIQIEAKAKEKQDEIARKQGHKVNP